MKLVKRNAVVGAVVLFVCVAVYLNWDYQRTGQATDVGKTLGEAALVAGETKDPLLGTDGGQQAVPQGDSAASEYFANARLNRQQARDSALTMLQESMAGEGVDALSKEQTNLAIQTMADSTVTEAQIENLIVAKGYKDCVAFIGEESISVVVQTAGDELTAVDTARITDIVTQATSFTAGQIKIIQVNG
ncbi:MAG: SpoIIIAH-like family protein [Oscillospiraceae bacterium]|nr:SpoIIIAH-like family protein [Oscillospiraceae bacterium]